MFNSFWMSIYEPTKGPCGWSVSSVIVSSFIVLWFLMADCTVEKKCHGFFPLIIRLQILVGHKSAFLWKAGAQTV